MSDLSDEMLAEVAKEIEGVAKALKDLGNGDAATPMGAIEAHGVAVKEGMETVAAAIDSLADAVRELAAATRAT